jgi:hypothetical protein
MGLRQALACAAVTVALALTGCAASADENAAGTTTPVATDEGVEAAEAPVSAEALCAHLKKELPRIKEVGSEVAAGAQPAMGIATLYDDHLDQLDGDVIDAQAEKSCPRTRAALLDATGLASPGSL